jgi:flagellar motor protein MotB
MDWKKTFNHGQWIIHIILLVSIIFSLGSMIFSLKLNKLNITEQDRNLKISSLLHYFKNDQVFEKIGAFLSWAEPDKANEKIREISQKIAETEEILELKVSNDLASSIRTFNRLINSNSAISDPADALKVLGSKIQNLIDHSEQRKYLNILMVSTKMKQKLMRLNSKNVAQSVELKSLSSDLRKIDEIVSKSTLNDQEKEFLLSRLTSMKNEIQILLSLSSQTRDIKAHVTQASLSLSGWMLEVEKNASDNLTLRIEKQNRLILILASLVAFLIFAWVSIAYIFRWQKNRICEQVEEEIKSVVEKGIIGDQRFVIDHYSDSTRNDIIKLLDELKLKLNLGSMLHTGLPFAGCLFDMNFKLTWHNNLFLEQFYLSEEEVLSDSFNWDFLRDYLSLDDDPVYEALAKKNSGIYPVKVKQDDFAPSQPYEMYVTPIHVNREDRVMVFFYPLVSVKEAINDQVHLAHQSLEKFIKFWKSEERGDKYLGLLEKDFKKNNLEEIFQSFTQLFYELEAEKKEYLRTISQLESDIMAFQNMMSEINFIEEEKKEIIRHEIQLIQDLRNSFIVCIERMNSTCDINHSILKYNDDLKIEAQKMHQLYLEIEKKLSDTKEISDQLDNMRSDYKKLKLELLEIKMKLISFNNSFFAQLPPFDENQQKLAHRYKDELSRLDFNVTTLDKKLSQLDVFISKLHMMYEKKSSEQLIFNFTSSLKDHEIKEAFFRIEKNQEIEESKVFENFKTLHSLLKKDFSKSHQVLQMSREDNDVCRTE